MKRCAVGGQAVMEGVMMKNPANGTALAVRQSDGTIVTEYYQNKKKYKKGSFPTWPVVRGVYAFVEALTGGLKITTRSAELLGDYVAKPPGKLALVPEDDPRPPVDLVNAPAQEFEALSDGEE